MTWDQCTTILYLQSVLSLSLSLSLSIHFSLSQYSFLSLFNIFESSLIHKVLTEDRYGDLKENILCEKKKNKICNK